MLRRKMEKTCLKVPGIPHGQGLFAIRLMRAFLNQKCVIQKLPESSSDGGRAITGEQDRDFFRFPPAIEEVQDRNQYRSARDGYAGEIVCAAETFILEGKHQ